MSFRSILVHVSPLERRAAPLHVAADLARRFEATLVGLGCEGVLSMATADDSGVGGSAWDAEMRRFVERDLEAAHRVFERAAGSNESCWREARGSPSQAMIASAALADLLVVGPDIGGDIDAQRGVDAGEVILGAGRPVLRVPDSHTHLSAQHIVVAWKPCREARRAVADALPLLVQAKDVVLVVATGRAEKDEAVADAEDVATTLRRHGAPARVAWVGATAGGGGTAQLILEKARRIGADLIVCGGYGHSRVGERMFGGVTRDLLRQHEVFVLFSH